MIISKLGSCDLVARTTKVKKFKEFGFKPNLYKKNFKMTDKESVF